MMNKKVLAVMMAVVVILALVLVGCGKPSEHIVPGSSSANGTGVEDWDDVVNDNGGNAEQSGSASGSASDSSGSSSGSSSGNKSSSSSSSSPLLSSSCEQQSARRSKHEHHDENN